MHIMYKISTKTFLKAIKIIKNFNYETICIYSKNKLSDISIR